MPTLHDKDVITSPLAERLLQPNRGDIVTICLFANHLCGFVFPGHKYVTIIDVAIRDLREIMMCWGFDKARRRREECELNVAPGLFIVCRWPARLSVVGLPAPAAIDLICDMTTLKN